MDVDVEVDVDLDRYFGSLKEASKSVQVLFNGIEAVLVLTLILLKQRALLKLREQIPGPRLLRNFLGVCPRSLEARSLTGSETPSCSLKGLPKRITRRASVCWEMGFTERPG